MGKFYRVLKGGKVSDLRFSHCVGPLPVIHDHSSTSDSIIKSEETDFQMP